MSDLKFEEYLKKEKNISVKLKKVADGLVSPTVLANDGQRLYVVDQIGKIYIIDEDGLIENPFFDISDLFKELKPAKKDKDPGLSPSYDERGLTGLAFHPNYQSNGRFFVYHSSPKFGKNINHESILAEYKISNNLNKADMNSKKVLFRLDQPKFTHNGGGIIFDSSGKLYLGLGDGGCCGDKFGEIGNGQNLSNLYGTIIRIDVDQHKLYTVPYDNPFVNDENIRSEIYAYGLRNPWGVNFDKESNRLFSGNVGESSWESIFLIKRGGNHGWRIREGKHFYDRKLMEKLNLTEKDLIDPIYEWPRSEGICAIGGYIYRGEIFPELYGKYIFGNWTSTHKKLDGTLHYLEEESINNWKKYDIQLPKENGLLGRYINAIGEDHNRELYILTKKVPGPTKSTGEVLKLDK